MPSALGVDKKRGPVARAFGEMGQAGLFVFFFLFYSSNLICLSLSIMV
jgi:hypothetical protein